MVLFSEGCAFNKLVNNGSSDCRGKLAAANHSSVPVPVQSRMRVALTEQYADIDLIPTTGRLILLVLLLVPRLRNSHHPCPFRRAALWSLGRGAPVHRIVPRGSRMPPGSLALGSVGVVFWFVSSFLGADGGGVVHSGRQVLECGGIGVADGGRLLPPTLDGWRGGHSEAKAEVRGDWASSEVDAVGHASMRGSRRKSRDGGRSTQVYVAV